MYRHLDFEVEHNCMYVHSFISYNLLLLGARFKNIKLTPLSIHFRLNLNTNTERVNSLNDNSLDLFELNIYSVFVYLYLYIRFENFTIILILRMLLNLFSGESRWIECCDIADMFACRITFCGRFHLQRGREGCTFSVTAANEYWIVTSFGHFCIINEIHILQRVTSSSSSS